MLLQETTRFTSYKILCKGKTEIRHCGGNEPAHRSSWYSGKAPNLYLGGARFKSRQIQVVYPGVSQSLQANSIMSITPRSLPSKSFPVYY
jgi:hypothetical protein